MVTDLPMKIPKTKDTTFTHIYIYASMQIQVQIYSLGSISLVFKNYNLTTRIWQHPNSLNKSHHIVLCAYFLHIACYQQLRFPGRRRQLRVYCHLPHSLKHISMYFYLYMYIDMIHHISDIFRGSISLVI